MSGVDIKAIGDALAALSVKNASGLAGYLKETYGIEAPQGVSVVQRAATDVKPDDEDASPAVVDVVLKAAGDKKIGVIKIVRQHTGLGLKEAKDLVDGAPKVVKAGVDRAEAEKFRKELEEHGATVELQ